MPSVSRVPACPACPGHGRRLACPVSRVYRDTDTDTDTMEVKENGGCMRTENGLLIVRVGNERGGFRVEMRMPADHDPEEKVFSRISRDRDGVWESNTDQIRTRTLVDAIDSIDKAYARERQRLLAHERRRQEERNRADAEVANDWQDVIDHFGGGTPDATD